ncbi:hypothetical protein EJB05_10461, partial [Eragrostis curvula]
MDASDFIGSSWMALFGSLGVYRTWIDAHVSESSKDYITGRSTLEDRRMNHKTIHVASNG